MRIVFIGTPDFAVPPLLRLIELDLQICMVVTRPDSESGRGRKLARSAVKKTAAASGLMIYQPRKLSDSCSKGLFERIKPDIGVIVAYGEILSRWVIECFPVGLFNLHASLLPAYRGAAPINHALLNGEKRTGVTVQRVVPSVDAGPILASESVEIGPHENAGQLHDRLSALGAGCLGDVIGALAGGEKPDEYSQDESKVTYAPKLSKEDGRIDWSSGAETINNRIRGLYPWPGAFSTFKGSSREEKVTIIQAVPADRRVDVSPGTVVEITDDDEFLVACGDGRCLCIKKLKPAGGKILTAPDFVHGRHLDAGERFQ